MPYPNEHAARLQDPQKFAPDSFRRVNGGTIYGSKKVPKTIAIIWAKLRRRNKPRDNPLPQALRFPVKTYTSSEAKAWLKKNKIKYIKFESATKSKEKHSMKDKNKDTVAYKDCIFAVDQDVVSDKESNSFKIIAYNGKVNFHPCWGNFAIDLSGLTFAKKPTPIIESHDRVRRVGVSTKQKIEGGVEVEGRFLDNDIAVGIKKDMLNGYPFEASLYVPPSVVEHVGEGASVKVNNHILKGPGTVFRKAVIKEVSVCTLGALTGTSTNAFNDKPEVKFSIVNEENTKMSEEMTKDTFAEEHPDIHSQIYADGEKAERDLFAELKEVCGADLELLVQCFEEGKSKEETLELRSEKQEKAITELKAKVEELQTETKVEVKEEKEKVSPAKAEFSDQAPEVNTEKTDPEFAWREKYPNSKVPVDKFRTEESYLAFCKADAKGLISIHKKKPVKEEN